jgi:hypothetical protein
MWDRLEDWFGGGFIPHGHCYLWTPSMVWTEVLANLFIGASYVAISLALYRMLFRVRAVVPFSWLFLPFAVFILACGGTHFLDVVTVWHPIYWLDAAVRVLTAAASVGTALLLLRLMPKAIRVAEDAQSSKRAREILERAAKREKGVDLEALATEMAEQGLAMEKAFTELRLERDRALAENAELRSRSGA